MQQSIGDTYGIPTYVTVTTAKDISTTTFVIDPFDLNNFYKGDIDRMIRVGKKISRLFKK